MLLQHIADVWVHSFISTSPKADSPAEQITAIIAIIPGKLTKKLIEPTLIPQQITAPKTLKTDHVPETLTNLAIKTNTTTI